MSHWYTRAVSATLQSGIYYPLILRWHYGRNLFIFLRFLYEWTHRKSVNVTRCALVIRLWVKEFISNNFSSHPSEIYVLHCKIKMQYLLTLQVSKYCLLALHGCTLCCCYRNIQLRVHDDYLRANGHRMLVQKQLTPTDALETKMVVK